jgi:hypothetical protein
MIYSNTPNPPAKFTATMYGKTVTIELDHSDFDLTELMEIFKGLTIASGFEMSSWNSVIKDLSAEIHDNEREDLKEKLEEWKFDDEDTYTDLRHSTPKDRLDEWKAKNGFGSWTEDSKDKAPFKEFGDEDDEVIADVRKRYNKDSEGYESLDELDEEFFGKTEDYEGQFKDWANETPIEDEVVDNPTYDWDDNIKGYDYESNDMISNINDSITIIKDRMVDIDLKMDNIDEQLGILNADVANIELNIQHPLKQSLLNAKEVYDKSLIETGRQLFQKQKEAMDKFNALNDVVDMETGEVSVDGGFDGKALFAPYKRKPNQKVTEKVMSNEVRLGKWQTDNKTKEVVKLDKTKVRKGKIKDLKK